VDTAPRRIAVVTGANRGLAVASALAEQENLHVVLTARRLADAEAAAEQLTDDNRSVQGAELDVTDASSVFRLFADVDSAHGRLDVLVNNAGVAIDKGRSPVDHDIETIQATWNTNVLGAWRCCAKAVPLMRLHRYGRITNISSRMGSLALTSSANSPAYRVSKAALNQLTRVFAAEAAVDNILVNAASPGTVGTRMNYGEPRYSPDEAASRLLWLSLLPDSGPTGRFWDGQDSLPW